MNKFISGNKIYLYNFTIQGGHTHEEEKSDITFHNYDAMFWSDSISKTRRK